MEIQIQGQVLLCSGEWDVCFSLAPTSSNSSTTLLLYISHFIHIYNNLTDHCFHRQMNILRVMSTPEQKSDHTSVCHDRVLLCVKAVEVVNTGMSIFVI